MVVMCAFGAHSLKNISRFQMASAARYFMSDQTKFITKADKYQLIKPLAKAFINKGIVVVKEGADMEKLKRDDVNKEKTF